MKLFFISLLFLMAAVKSTAQDAGIRGRILDEKTNFPIAGATVAIYNVSDTSMEKEVASGAEGVFLIQNLRYGKYFLEITSVGYSTYRSNLFKLSKEDELNLGDFKLRQSSEILEGIIIAARKPMIENKADKLIYNVGSDVAIATSSAMDVLEKAPGVNVDKDGNISLRGKSGVVVLIDDRPTYMSNTDLANYLKSIPASSLEQLEIMTNPSAKYDAEGNSGIINIKTKKTKKPGLNGNASSSVRYADQFSSSGSLNFNYRKGKTNLFGNYSFSDNNFKGRQTIKRYFKDSESNDYTSLFDQLGNRTNHFINNNLKVGLDYYINRNTIVGMAVSGYHTKGNHLSLSDSWFREISGSPDSGLIVRSLINGITNNFSANMNLRHNFDSTGRKMTADVDYIIYDKLQTTSVLTKYIFPDGEEWKPVSLLTGKTPATIQIFSAKIDFSLPFKNIGLIETGIKGSRVTTDNDARYSNRIEDKDVPDYRKSNHFIYQENLMAAYITWNKRINKWSFQAGVRAENTMAFGHQLGNEIIKDSSFKKRYLNIFPTAYVNFNLNKENTFGLNIGRRIQRPNYADLNPFLYFVDEYTYQAGNVYLQPQFTNQAELSYGYKSIIRTALAYNHTSGAITEIIKQDAGKKIIYQTKDNVATQTGITLSTGASLRTGKLLSSNLDFVLNYAKYEGQISPDYFLDTRKWMYTIKLVEQADFGKGWAAEIDGYYYSPMIYGQIAIDKNWRLDGSVEKKILKEKGSIGFSLKDIFNSRKFKGTIKSNNMNVAVTNVSNNPVAGLSFRYSFGKPIKGLRHYKAGGASDEEGRVGAR